MNKAASATALGYRADDLGHGALSEVIEVFDGKWAAPGRDSIREAGMLTLAMQQIELGLGLIRVGRRTRSSTTDAHSQGDGVYA